MNLYKDIHSFFNEGRPRTKSAGIEDIERPGSGRQQRDVDLYGDRKKPTKSYNINFNPEGIKSSYEPGSVHEIWFTTLQKTDQKKEKRIIYRNISEQDYKNLTQNSNPKIPILVTPSSEKNHYKDIYYITIPKVKYGTRTGKDFTYFVYLKDDYLQKLTQEEKDKIKLKLVPIEDISKGVDKRNLTADEIKLFLSDKNKEKLKKTKPKEIPKYSDEAETLDMDLSFLIDDEDIEAGLEKQPEDSPEIKASKLKAAEFMLDDKIERIFTQIIKNYDISKTTSASSSEIEDAKSKLNDLVKRFMDSLFEFTDKEEDRKAVITYNVENKLKQKPGLYKMLKTIYDNMESLKENNMITEEQTKQQYFLVPTDTERGKLFKKVFDNDPSFTKINFEGEDGYVKSFTPEQLLKIKDTAKDGLNSIKQYKSEPGKKIETPAEQKDYKVGISLDGGKENISVISGNNILKLIRLNPSNKDISFEELEVNKPYEFTQKMSVGPDRKGVIMIKSMTPSGEKGKRTEFITIDKTQKPEKEKDAVPTKTLRTSISGQGARSYKVPVNMGVKMADVKPSQLRFKYYVIDTVNKEMVNGSDDWAETKKMAQEMGSGYEAVQKAALSSKGVKINEALSEEDKNILKNYRVSFIVQDRLDTNKKFNVNDNVKDYKDEKTQFIINLVQAGTLTFDKSGTTVFKNNKNEEFQVVSVPDTLSKIVKKSFEAEQPQSNTDSKLESYIRKRIKEAIKEAEVSQYWGYQGADVKKKRLEEYMKKYEWGFQDSKNPYTHSIGSEKHAIVSKLVHELEAMGENGIAMFNSYAPEGYEISSLTDLDDMADTPLGSQLTQPYNPDSLTARGGRVAEMNGPVPTKGQGADQLDRLVANITPKLKADIVAKGSAQNAKELISVFRQAKGIADDVTDDMIYNKIKSA